MMPASDLIQSHYNHKTEDLAYIVIQVAQYIPYSHRSQDKLLKIVQNLMTSDRFVGTVDLRVPYYGPSGATKGGQIYRRGINRWNKPSEVITESWIGNCYWDAPGQDSGFKAHHYVSFHAFLARFVAWQAATGDSWLLWPLRTLGSRLEPPLRRPDEPLDTVTAGAALLLLYSGQWLFERVVMFPPASLDDGYVRGISSGELYSGPVLGLERWRYWRQTLKARTEDNQLGSEARRLALKAVDFMECLERNDPRLERTE